MPSSTDWVSRLSPWPTDGFGLERIHAVLAELGEPQRRYPAIHVVGTNGKSTLTRTVDATLRSVGLRVGSFTSPHVSGWGERIQIDGEEADFEAAVARVREVCERARATQFETLTAAALQAFADADVDVAVVEAGLGGRHDATNVLDARVVALTNVSLEHTEVLGSTREAIAREKLAVAGPGAIVVLGEPEWAYLVPDNPVVAGGAREVVEAFLGRTADLVTVTLPGRLERLDGEIRDGGHNLAGIEWLVERIEKVAVIVCSILADKDVDAMLAALAARSTQFIATSSSSPRALPAQTLADAALRHFAVVECVPDPVEALARGHELGEPVLVTGSLYLLADLAAVRPGGLPWLSTATS